MKNEEILIFQKNRDFLLAHDIWSLFEPLEANKPDRPMMRPLCCACGVGSCGRGGGVTGGGGSCVMASLTAKVVVDPL